MLGANVGTTLIVQVLSFNIAAAAPVLFVIGWSPSAAARASRIKDLGRVAIGLGLMLLALHILLDTLAPAENAPGVRVLLDRHHRRSRPVHRDRRHRDLGGAFERGQRAPGHVARLFPFRHARAALALVLGANLGSAINPLFEGAQPRRSRRATAPLGNLINRLIGIAVVAALPAPDRRILQIGSPTRQDDRRISYCVQRANGRSSSSACWTPLPLLDECFPNARRRPIPRDHAISTRARSKRRPSRSPMRRAKPCIWAIIVEVMLRKVMEAIMTNDRKLVDRGVPDGQSVDSLDEAIKLYVDQD